MHPSRRSLWTAFLATAGFALGGGAGAVPAPANAATQLGLSEQQPEPWGDARLRSLGLRYARLIVPWDAATSEPARVQAWLDAVAAAGMAPHIAFEHLRSDDCAGDGPCVVPSRTQCPAPRRQRHRRVPEPRPGS